MVFWWCFNENFYDYSNIFPSKIPIQIFPSKYSHQIFPSHIPTLKDDLSQGECITSQDSTSWSARLGRERVHLHDRHRGLVRGLHGRKARKGPGLGQWRWAERRGSPWTFLGKILQSSYLGGETSWWFQHVSNMFQFFSRRNGTPIFNTLRQKNMAVENIRIYGKNKPARNLHLAGDFHIWWHQRVLCHLEQLAQNHHQALGTSPRSTCFMPMTTLRCPPERPVRMQPWRRLQLSRGRLSWCKFQGAEPHCFSWCLPMFWSHLRWVKTYSYHTTGGINTH